MILQDILRRKLSVAVRLQWLQWCLAPVVLHGGAPGLETSH